jgi:hypothetical protein
MMRTLFLQAPSFEGFDGGAGSRYQARREIRSFWYPTWLAQPAALVENSKLIDAPPHRFRLAQIAANARDCDLVEAIKALKAEFYRRFYFRSGKIASIVGEMVRSTQMMKRRLREGVEFFHFLRERHAAH